MARETKTALERTLLGAAFREAACTSLRWHYPDQVIKGWPVAGPLSRSRTPTAPLLLSDHCSAPLRTNTRCAPRAGRYYAHRRSASLPNSIRRRRARRPATLDREPPGAPSTAGCSACCHCSARLLASNRDSVGPTGEWTRPTLGSAAAGITSIEPSMGVVRSSMLTCRQHATRLRRADSSSGRSPPAGPRRGGSSLTKPLRAPTPW
jgi:hypothetical protein